MADNHPNSSKKSSTDEVLRQLIERIDTRSPNMHILANVVRETREQFGQLMDMLTEPPIFVETAPGKPGMLHRAIDRMSDRITRIEARIDRKTGKDATAEMARIEANRKASEPRATPFGPECFNCGSKSHTFREMQACGLVDPKTAPELRDERAQSKDAATSGDATSTVTGDLFAEREIIKRQLADALGVAPGVSSLAALIDTIRARTEDRLRGMKAINAVRTIARMLGVVDPNPDADIVRTMVDDAIGRANKSDKHREHGLYMERWHRATMKERDTARMERERFKAACADQAVTIAELRAELSSHRARLAVQRDRKARLNEADRQLDDDRICTDDECTDH